MPLRSERSVIRMLAAVVAVGIVLMTSSHSAHAADPGVRFGGRLTCLDGGGARFLFTVKNTGTAPLLIHNDFHAEVTRVRARASKGILVLFVFPARSHQRIPPGESRTFTLGIGEPIEGEPPADLRGRELRIETEMWFKFDPERGFHRRFSFPGCPWRPPAGSQAAAR